MKEKKKINLSLIGATGLVGFQIIQFLDSLDRDKYDINVRALVRKKGKNNLNKDFVTEVEGDLNDEILNDLFFEDREHVVFFGSTVLRSDDDKKYKENVFHAENILRSTNKFSKGVIYNSSLSSDRITKREKIRHLFLSGLIVPFIISLLFLLLYSYFDYFLQGDLKLGDPLLLLLMSIVYGGSSLFLVLYSIYILRSHTALAESRLNVEKKIRKMENNKIIAAGIILRPRFILGREDKHTMREFIEIVKKKYKLGNEQQNFTVIDASDYARLIVDFTVKILNEGFEGFHVFDAGYSSTISLEDFLKPIKQHYYGNSKMDFIDVPSGSLKLFLYLRRTSLFFTGIPFPIREYAEKLHLLSFDHSGNTAKLRKYIDRGNFFDPDIDPRQVVNTNFKCYISKNKD